MSRPVGSYYARGGGANSQAPTPVSNISADWDWGSPTNPGSKNTTDWSSAGGNTASQGMGTSTTSTNWYSGNAASNNTPTAPAPSPYATSGIANASAATSSTNPNAPSSFVGTQSQQPIQGHTGYFQPSGPAQQQQEQQPLLSGAMDSSAPSMMPPTAPHNNGQQQVAMSMPQMPQAQPQKDAMPYFGDEAPLLEEIGIDASHILGKTKAVVLPFSRFNGGNVTLDPKDIAESADMAGPIELEIGLGICRHRLRDAQLWSS